MNACQASNPFFMLYRPNPTSLFIKFRCYRDIENSAVCNSLLTSSQAAPYLRLSLTSTTYIVDVKHFPNRIRLILSISRKLFKTTNTNALSNALYTTTTSSLAVAAAAATRESKRFESKIFYDYYYDSKRCGAARRCCIVYAMHENYPAGPRWGALRLVNATSQVVREETKQWLTSNIKLKLKCIWQN